MFPYIPTTPDDEKEMLEYMGMKSMEELFCGIPDDVKLDRRLNLNPPMSEIEVSRKVRNLANKNNVKDMVCFLGAGAYDHYIPSVVRHIVSKPEFYTAYTPYQPEISQGTLQAIFEYQSMISNLTDMAMANASMYDGPSACAEAAMLSMGVTKRKKVIVSKTVHPETRQTLKTYIRFRGGSVCEVDFDDGVTDIDKLKSQIDEDTAAVIIQSPNFFGCIEDTADVEKIVHNNKSIFIMSVNPISLGILKTPGEAGADIAVGEGQALGNPMNFGGPYLGFMAATSKLMRKMPGRVVGETCDVDGKRGFVLTLQAREQHIRREKATSNICSNQALNALTAAVYMSIMGKQGIKEAALQCAAKTRYAMDSITRSGKYKLLFDKPVFNEFAVVCSADTGKVSENLMKNGIIGGYELQKSYDGLKDSLLFCVTEKRAKEEIDLLVKVLEEVE